MVNVLLNLWFLEFSSSSVDIIVIGGDSFLDQGGVSFGHPFEYISFLWASIHFDSQSVVDGSDFLNQNPYMTSRLGMFHFGTFLSIALSESRYILALGPSLSPSNSFSMLYIHSNFLLRSLRSHILISLLLLLLAGVVVVVVVVTWNRIIIWNIWNHNTLCKLFIWERNHWIHITERDQIIIK